MQCFTNPFGSLIVVRPRCARPNGARDKFQLFTRDSAAEQLNEAEIPLCGTPLASLLGWAAARMRAPAQVGVPLISRSVGPYKSDGEPG